MVSMTRPLAAPLRPLGTAEILDAAVRLVTRNLPAVLTIAVPFAILRTGLAALLQYAAIQAKSTAVLEALATLVLATGLGVLLTGLLAPLFSADLLGGRMTAGGSLRRVGRTCFALVALAVIVTVAESAGLVALAVGGVWLWGVWAVAAPALILERTGAGGALRRSFGLVRNFFWRTWGIRTLGWLLISVLGLLVTVPFEALAAALTGTNPLDTAAGVQHPGLYVTITSIGALVAAALIAPVSAAIDLVLYTDLRMRKEGMDIALALPPAPAAAVTA